MQRVTQEVIVWRKEGSHRKRKKALFFFLGKGVSRGSMGCRGLLERVVRCGVMWLQQIGGEQGFKVTADWRRTKFQPKGHELYRNEP